MVGAKIGCLSIEESAVSRGLPSQITATSVLVPPISKAITFSKPATAPTATLAATPPAGPEKMVRTGLDFAVAAEITPPDD